MRKTLFTVIAGFVTISVSLPTLAYTPNFEAEIEDGGRRLSVYATSSSSDDASCKLSVGWQGEHGSGTWRCDATVSARARNERVCTEKFSSRKIVKTSTVRPSCR